MKTRAFIDMAAASSHGFVKALTQISIATSLVLSPFVIELGTDLNTGASVYAGNGQGSGSGSGGGNSGGGQGGSGGNGGSGPEKGDLYGDMIYLARYDDGTPLIDQLDADGLPATHPNDTVYYCIRPIAADGSLLPLVWEELFYGLDLVIPETCADIVATGFAFRNRAGLDLLAEEESEFEYCDVIPVCADDVVEVDLGRLSLLRSPDKVLDRQRDEAIRNIIKAGYIVDLDEGGRFVVGGATFDSPLINLAMMREFHLWDALYDGTALVFDPAAHSSLIDYFIDPPAATYDWMYASAFGLGAGDDKEGAGVDTEVVVRINAILDLPARVDADKTIGNDGEYIDYSDFSYSRADTFPGCVQYYTIVDNALVSVKETIVNAVFQGEDPGVVGNIAGYALAANDARRVLLFTHDLSDTLLQGVDRVFENSGSFCP